MRRLAIPAVLAAVLLLGACTGGSNGAPTIRLDALSPIACAAIGGTAGGLDCAAALDVTAAGGRPGSLVQGEITAAAIGGLIETSAESWSGAGDYSLPLHWSSAACTPGDVDLGVYAAVLMPASGGSYVIGAAVESSGYLDARSCS